MKEACTRSISTNITKTFLICLTFHLLRNYCDNYAKLMTYTGTSNLFVDDEKNLYSEET